MQYFTPQLWVAFQGPRSKAAFKIWDSRFAQYQQQLNKILPALNPPARNFFSHPLALHDGTLMRMEVGDRIDDIRVKPRRNIVNRRNLRVRLHVLAENVKQRRVVGHSWCVLEYRAVERVEVNYPGRLKLFPVGLDPNLGDWGYDELTCPAKNVFRHEILFSSGATITIDFRGFSFRRKRS
jgi:hypothetical protein